MTCLVPLNDSALQSGRNLMACLVSGPLTSKTAMKSFPTGQVSLLQQQVRLEHPPAPQRNRDCRESAHSFSDHITMTISLANKDRTGKPRHPDRDMSCTPALVVDTVISLLPADNGLKEALRQFLPSCIWRTHHTNN